LLASFQDSHIQLQLPTSEFIRFASEQGAFPLKVLLSDNQVIVLADEQSLPTIPVGAEIRRINNVPVEELIPLLGRMVPAETETGRQRLVQVHMPELLWAFFPESDSYDIDYYWRGNILRETLEPRLLNEPVTVAAATPEITSHYGDIAIDSNTTMLWLNDFNEQSDRFRDYLEELFVELRESNKKNLVLDLRYNKGGITDNLKQLLSYLTPRSIKWADSASLKISDAFKRQHSQLVDTTKSQKYTAYFGWLPMEYLTLWQWELLFSSEGDLLETSIETVVESQENYFTGDVIVLSNGYCFSACAALVSNLKSHKLATIIGEEPGSYIGSQFGYPVDVKLPNTGLILTVPAMEVVLHKDVGIREDLSPDHRVTRRKMDVRMGYDVVLLAALELIKLREQAKRLSNSAELH
jgi:hypothetical protein